MWCFYPLPKYYYKHFCILKKNFVNLQLMTWDVMLGKFNTEVARAASFL